LQQPGLQFGHDTNRSAIVYVQLDLNAVFSMPDQNQFLHQSYPTSPAIAPSFHKLTVNDGQNKDFSRLHMDLQVDHVILVHGTFMGDDPFAIAETLRAISESAPAFKKPIDALALRIQQYTKPLTDRVTGDVGNYTAEFRDAFQQLVGDDPAVHLMNPTWSGQNHHLARADLAVRLMCLLDDLRPEPHQRVLLWGHSHAGNGFAILSNLLANDRAAVSRFFDAASISEPHWQRAASILQDAPSPHPWSQSLLIAAFGTPVRYGWDTGGYNKLVQILHHRNYDKDNPVVTKTLYPPYSFGDMVSATYGDWVQAFGIAGTDTTVPTAGKSLEQLAKVLEAGLTEPEHGLDTKFILSSRVRNVCARWKTGTRCHTDGLNLLVEYEPSGRLSLVIPIEESLFGHAVATAINWLPAHVAMVMQAFGRDFAQ